MGLNDIWNNLCLMTDVYNLSHEDLKVNTDYEVSHIYNRSRPMIVYGVNELVRKVCNIKVSVDMIMEADEYARKMDMIFPSKMWMKVVDEWKGWLPLHVQALPDGTYVPTGTPFIQIKNTEEGAGEFVTWIEALLLRSYFPSACATEAFKIRRYLEANKLPLYRAHSFGMRGHRSQEDSYWAGTAWNLFLTGTDDFHTIAHTPNAPIKSIPATAHKVIQQFDNEMDAFKRAIDAATKYKTRMVALVIDTYDAWRVINDYVPEILQYAKNKDVRVVFRPDSGDVIEQALAMWKKYKDWNNWSMIIGEGMSYEKMIEYDEILKSNGYPLELMAYGIGGGFYNHIDRDYLGHAMKTAYSNGAPRMKLTKTNPYKQSIPDVVNLVYNEKGELMVEYTRDGLFVDVYHYDERSTRPKTHIQTWDNIKEIANRWINIPNLQERIILSPLVQQKISEFKIKYG